MPRARQLAPILLVFGALALAFATWVYSKRADPPPLRPNRHRRELGERTPAASTNAAAGRLGRHLLGRL
jgi:hypothetical protein